MDTALQGGCLKPRAREHVLRGGDMRWLAAVGRARERELIFGEAEAIRCARFDEQQRLQRLYCRARIDWPIDLAELNEDFPIGVGHSRASAVAALNQSTAYDFDKDRIIAHGLRQVSVSTACVLTAFAARSCARGTR
jgi:hypothetical protein